MKQTHIPTSALAITILLVAVGEGWSQDAPSANDAPVSTAPAAGDDLSVEQGRLADRFKRLEEVLGRLAELSASTDPRRARLLREAIARSREQDLNARFESIVKLLEEERLSAAATNQTELHQELDALLTLLLKADRDKELSSQRDRVRKYLKEISRLILLQKGIRARTEGGDELRSLAEDQQRVASDTGKLGGNIGESERDKSKGDGDAANDDRETNGDGKRPSEGESGESSDQSKPSDASKPGEPSEGDSAESPKSQPSEDQPSDGKPSNSSEAPPSDSKRSPGQPGAPSPGGTSGGDEQIPPQEPANRAAERLRSAQQQMQEARKKLDEAERQGATDRQRAAIKELEQAKAELERILRQLREEELERTLTQLAARFRKMLEWQNAVYEGTVRVDRVPQSERDHDDEIEAARLSRQESQIVHEANKSLLLLREEGSSVAFPETVEQMRDDMQQVTDRLAAIKVGAITQALEQDIIAALEETIAALEKALKDLEKNRTPPGQQPATGQQPEPPLVDKLAELKMIRSLQMRINKRTQRYSEMIQDEQAETPELLEALGQLAERQQRVYQATADLSQGRND